ncbi:hypothetical protein HMPREF1986_01763, partial [Oribacterium sp. oral taxon 078 str. F0263]
GSRSESVLRWADKRQIDLLSSKTELYLSKAKAPSSFALTRKGGRGLALPGLYSYCAAKCGIGIYFMDCIQLTLKGRPIRR